MLALSISLVGQTDTIKHKTDSLPERFYVLQNIYRDGETLPEIEIKEVTILGRRKGSAASYYRQYDRLVYNVRRTYPYAVIVRMKLDEVNSALQSLPDEKARKEYMKEVEKSVLGDYEDDMRHMTITQGKILIKLIDRETMNTSYDLIKDYRGWISAAFWQGIARIFGTNLKAEYDPYGEDAIIERIVQEIEAGKL
jgi:hypothetical protein